MRKEFKMVKLPLHLCLAICFLLLLGCGNGSGGSVPLPSNKGIVLSANLKQGLARTSSPIRAMEVTFTLPGSASPVLSPDGSLAIGFTGLYNLNPNGNIQTGSFDPVARTVHFVLLPNDIASTDLGPGSIARLTYETPSGAELSSQEIQSVSFKVSGPGSVDISNEIEPSISIVTYLKP
jgi:hypothetical protein